MTDHLGRPDYTTYVKSEKPSEVTPQPSSAGNVSTTSATETDTASI
jgi:hypothetical protein